MQRLINRFTGVVAAGVVALAGVAIAQETRPAEGQEKAPKAELNQAAPDFALPDVKDQNVTHRLSDHRGKIVVLHFESPTCPWDRGYQPYLNEVASKYQQGSADSEGEASAEAMQAESEQQQKPEVVFIAINSNRGETPEQLAAYHEQTQMTYPIAKDEGNNIADIYAARHTPHIYIIDPQGVLRYRGGVEEPPSSPRHIAKMDEQYLEPVLEAMVNGSELPHTDTRSKGCEIKRAR